MSTLIPKIAESYFQELLHEKPPIEATATLSMFWGHRLDSEKQDFGLSQPEYFLTLCMIYTGEVSNGGHSQYFSNRGTVLIPDTKSALRAIGCLKHAEVLTRAAEAVQTRESCKWIDLETFPESIFSLWATSDQELWSLTHVDRPLVEYLRLHSTNVLRLERGLD